MSVPAQQQAVDPWVTVKYFAEHWGVSEKTVYDWIEKRLVESRRLGERTIRVKLGDPR